MNEINPTDYAYPSEMKVYKNGKTDNFDQVNNFGLTKREYFAAMAMHGIISNSLAMNSNSKNKSLDEVIELVSMTAIEHADALITALNDNPNNGIDPNAPDPFEKWRDQAE